jgi:hypothetical protein
MSEVKQDHDCSIFAQPTGQISFDQGWRDIMRCVQCGKTFYMKERTVVDKVFIELKKEEPKQKKILTLH